jgi:hypothetical protein
LPTRSLKYRRAVQLLAKAIGWADAGAPFGVISPGPYWRPRGTIDGDGTPEMPRRPAAGGVGLGYGNEVE